jgi:hypothetical protein
MPRHPKNRTPLRIFREQTGHSQKSFAQAISKHLDLSPEMYKAYELGARGLPLAAAIRLMLLYGVDPHSIMTETGVPRDISGRPYSRHSFDTWPGERVYDARALPDIIQRATDRLIRMLLSARRAGRFTLALQMLDESLAKMQDDLLLEAHYQALSNENLPFEQWSPIKIYTAGAPVKIPEQADFPLASSALRTMDDLISKKQICRGKNREEFDAKEGEFFSGKRRH